MEYFQAEKGQERENESAEASWTENGAPVINHKLSFVLKHDAIHQREWRNILRAMKKEKHR